MKNEAIICQFFLRTFDDFFWCMCSLLFEDVREAQDRKYHCIVSGDEGTGEGNPEGVNLSFPKDESSLMCKPIDRGEENQK